MHRREPGFYFNVLQGFPFPEHGQVMTYDKEGFLDENYLVEGVIVKNDNYGVALAEETDVINSNFRVVVKDGLNSVATLRFADNWRFATDQIADMSTVITGDQVKVARIADDAETGEPRFQYEKADPVADVAVIVATVAEKRADCIVLQCPAK